MRPHLFLRTAYLLLSFLIVSIPSLFAQEKEGEKKYHGRLWAITGNGAADTSYLYGTIHIRDSKAYQFPKRTEQALNSVDALALELNMDSVNSFTLMNKLMMEDSTTLRDLLSKKEYKDVKRYTDSLGMNLKALERFHPMLTLSRIQMQSFDSDSDQALDQYFYMLAKKKRKEVIGLETVEEQAGAFQSIPYDSTAQQLVKIARGEIENSGGQATMDRMLEQYVEGDLMGLLKVMKDEQTSKEFEKHLLVDRNIRMADRAVEHLKERSIFIAVGAAHLPGEKGIIELLRDKGFKVVSISGNE